MTKQLLKSINCGQENTTSSNNKGKSLNFMPVSVVIIYVRSYTLLCNSYRDIHCNYGYTLKVIFVLLVSLGQERGDLKWPPLNEPSAQ